MGLVLFVYLAVGMFCATGGAITYFVWGHRPGSLARSREGAMRVFFATFPIWYGPAIVLLALRRALNNLHNQALSLLVEPDPADEIPGPCLLPTKDDVAHWFPTARLRRLRQASIIREAELLAELGFEDEDHVETMQKDPP